MLIPNNRGRQARQLIEDNLRTGSEVRRFSIRNETDPEESTVLLYDYIGWPFNDPADFAQHIMSITAKTIHLRIHSPGGSVYDAVDMLTKLRMHPANVIVHIDGLAASAATVVAMAGSEVRMTKGARFMIHNASVITWGDAKELRADADFLDKVDSDLAGIYQGKSKQDLEKIRAWMDAESWFSADEAREYGFVDVVEDGTPAANVYNLSAFGRVPEDLAVPAQTAMAIPAACGRDRNARLLALTERMGR